MTIAYGPAIINGGTVFWLPLPILSFDVTLQMRNESVAIPGVAGRTLLFSERDGYNISIRGQILGYALDGSYYSTTVARTAENAQNIKRAMEGYDNGTVVSDRPFDGTFTLWRWKDRCYTGCSLISMGFSEGRVGSSVIPYSLEISATGAYLDTSDSISDASTWKNFIGNTAGH